jgi:hypothetical protein
LKKKIHSENTVLDLPQERISSSKIPPKVSPDSSQNIRTSLYGPQRASGDVHEIFNDFAEFTE